MTRTRLTLTSVFYAVVATVALIGATQAAQSWLHWPLYGALLAVGSLELGGIVLAHHAAKRRQLGEAALAARVASAVVAGAAVVANVAGHLGSLGQAAFFGVMSGLGYVTWLIDAESRRRDALRAAGLLAEIPPVFGLGQWLREPRITRRARVLAQQRAAERLTDPTLPRLDALAALALARGEARQRVRHAAIARVLHRKIRSAVDRDTADIATAVYDLEQVAVRLASQADYDALTHLIGMDLAPARLTGAAQLPPVTSAQLPLMTSGELPVITSGELPLITGAEVPLVTGTELRRSDDAFGEKVPSRRDGISDLPHEATVAQTTTVADAEVKPVRAPRKAAAKLATPRKAAPKKTTRRSPDETRKLAEEVLASAPTTRAEVAEKLDITPRRLRQVLNETSGELPVITSAQLPLITTAELPPMTGAEVLKEIPVLASSPGQFGGARENTTDGEPSREVPVVNGHEMPAAAQPA